MASSGEARSCLHCFTVYRTHTANDEKFEQKSSPKYLKTIKVLSIVFVSKNFLDFALVSGNGDLPSANLPSDLPKCNLTDRKYFRSVQEDVRYRRYLFQFIQIETFPRAVWCFGLVFRWELFSKHTQREPSVRHRQGKASHWKDTKRTLSENRQTSHCEDLRLASRAATLGLKLIQIESGSQIGSESVVPAESV